MPQGEEEKKEESKDGQGSAQAVFDKCVAEGGRVFDLDELNIKDLKSFGELPATTEEVSLFNNKILNPNEIIHHLVPLPELKAIWL